MCPSHDRVFTAAVILRSLLLKFVFFNQDLHFQNVFVLSGILFLFRLNLSVSHAFLALVSRRNAFGRFDRSVDGTARLVLLSISCIAGDTTRSTVSTRSGSLDVSSWASNSQLSPAQAHSPFAHALPMLASCQAPGGRRFIQAFVCKSPIGLAQDLPDHRKAWKSFQIFLPPRCTQLPLRALSAPIRSVTRPAKPGSCPAFADLFQCLYCLVAPALEYPPSRMFANFVRPFPSHPTNCLCVPPCLLRTSWRKAILSSAFPPSSFSRTSS